MTKTLTRRSLLAAAGATALSAPFVRGAFAAGKLSLGFWDHWVPGANDVLAKLCHEWADKEKVDIAIDFITSNGDKLLLTISGERESKSGHDVLTFGNWNVRDKADALEPVDDVVKALIATSGATPRVANLLGQEDGHWIAVPTCVGTQSKPPCGRIDLLKEHAGLDVQAMYPAGAPANKDLADKWTWDAFLDAAQKCAKAGFPFGMPLGTTSDSYDWVSDVFHAHGAMLVDADGNVTVKSDATRQVLQWFQKLVPSLPAEVFAWDDAGNNKWLISGKGSSIMNPPSAWAVAKRDNIKVAEQCWTHDMPRGPKGRFAPYLPFYYGVWTFAQNKSAAMDLIHYIVDKPQAKRQVAASVGYDLPAFKSYYDFDTWKTVEPPKGTVYNYPPRGDEELSITGYPARADVAAQIYNQSLQTVMIGKVSQGGEKIDDVVKWAKNECEGYLRS